MARNSQIDSLELVGQGLSLPYRTNIVVSELDDSPRLKDGSNVFSLASGKLVKRGGFTEVASSNLALRIDRLWIYQTMETPAKIYLLASALNGSVWKMYYNRLDTATGWVDMGTTRNIHNSTVPHEVVVARGLAYIRATPTNASGEKLGTVIFDGSGGSPTVKLWGILGPTTPASIVGAVTYITSAITAGATSLTVNSNTGFPAVSFTILVDFEEMTVTAGPPGSTTWTVTRGVNGTTAAAHDTKSIVLWRDFSASTHIAEIGLGWKYTYCYKTTTGQISNRAPFQTNPDKLPSSTGPFTNLLPKINWTGSSDTTNVTKAIIGRTTDGGGTNFKLLEVNNANGTQTFTDDDLESGSAGGTFADPQPDDVIDQNFILPSLTSNSPPPAVLPPLVTGTDTPQAGTKLVYYAGRIWYAIGNTVSYSAQEELTEGIPEESFPSGLFGNFFRFQNEVTNIEATEDGVYVFTNDNVNKITGTNRETFAASKVLEKVGHPKGHLRAVRAYGRRVVFLTQDFRIGVLDPDRFTIISDDLYNDVSSVINGSASAEADIEYFSNLEKELIIVAVHRKDAPTNSRQWIYDVKKSRALQALGEIESPENRHIHFWNPPWTAKITAMVCGRGNEGVSNNRWYVYIWDGSAGRLARWRDLIDSNADATGAGSTEGYAFSATTGNFQVPVGNHVNLLRRPLMLPDVYALTLDYVTTGSDPTVEYYKDDLWTNPLAPATGTAPSHRDQSTGYTTKEYHIGSAMRNVAFKISRTADTASYELLRATIAFLPESGA